MKPARKEEMMHYWFSKKQQATIQLIGDPRTFVRLSSGMIDEYTECDESADYRPSWDDAVYLGTGKFHHFEGRLVPEYITK